MQSDFNLAAQRAAVEAGGEHLLPIVRKELLHYEILFALDRANLLQGLVFQGGTALRLCYDAPRFSEDLDFAGGPDFDAGRLKGAKAALERRVQRRFDVEAVVKEPRVRPVSPGVTVYRWWMVVKVAGDRPDVPRLRVRLEVANVLAHSREVRALNVHYSGLPDGYGDLLIAAESLDEVMADKLVSLAATGSRVRHRDIWDLRWLKMRGAAVRVDWVARKLRDYGVENYREGLDSMRERLPEIVQGEEFRKTMANYLSLEVQERTMGRKEFPPFLAAEVRDLLRQVREGLDAQERQLDADRSG